MFLNLMAVSGLAHFFIGGWLTTEGATAWGRRDWGSVARMMILSAASYALAGSELGLVWKVMTVLP